VRFVTRDDSTELYKPRVPRERLVRSDPLPPRKRKITTEGGGGGGSGGGGDE